MTGFALGPQMTKYTPDQSAHSLETWSKRDLESGAREQSTVHAVYAFSCRVTTCLRTRGDVVLGVLTEKINSIVTSGQRTCVWYNSEDMVLSEFCIKDFYNA